MTLGARNTTKVWDPKTKQLDTLKATQNLSYILQIHKHLQLRYQPTLHLPVKQLHLSQVQLCVSHTLKMEDTLAANTLWESGDHDTRASPPPSPRLTLVATPMGMSQVIRLVSAGEPDTRKFPWEWS